MISFQYRPDASHSIDAMVDELSQALNEGKRVVWMVCGGSNIPAEVQAMSRLPADRTSQLTIFLTDERYGKPGHADSNWTQLHQAGFNGQAATVIETLAADSTVEDTCRQYGQAVRDALSQADVVVAQFGIGGDGHIAGILPQSPALGSTETVAAYDAGNFMRVTLTPSALQHIDSAYAMAFGSTKRHAMEQLRDQTLSLNDQPAQILKSLPRAAVYSDQYQQ